MNQRQHLTPTLSIIVPAHNEEDSIAAFFAELLSVLRQIALPFEIVCVNDGSRDQTLPLLLQQQQQTPEIVIVDLSRNFGKEAALTAGFLHATGDIIVPMDIDLQHPPELLPQMVEKWRQGFDMVVTARIQRHDGLFKKISANGFYKIFNWFAEMPLVPNSVDFRLLDKSLVDALLLMPEKNRFLKGMTSWLTNNFTVLYYDQPQREHGVSRWGVDRLWKLALDAITSFSSLPLRVWSYVGCLVSFTAFIYILIIIIQKIFWGNAVSGYSSLMVTVLFLGGIQLISLGVMGEYIGRIYTEAKARPTHIIKKIYKIQ